MGWNEGIKLGLSAYESSLTRQQQERENKRADERFAMEQERFGMEKARTARDSEWQDVERGRKRTEYAEQDKLNVGIDAYREKSLKDLSNPWAESNWQAQAGLRPSAAQGFEGYEAPAYTATQGLEPAYIRRQREALAGRVSVAGRDRGAIAGAMDEDRKLEMGNTAAQINSYVLGATPEQLAELGSKVTLDKRNQYEIKINEKTGMSTVVHGDKKVELSRNDLGKFMAASYRLKQGDASAAAEIDGIDTKLTGIVNASLIVAAERAKVDNDVRYKVDNTKIASDTQATTAARNLVLGSDATRTAEEIARHHKELERVARTNAAKAGRGAPVQLVNEKGEAGLFYLDKTNQKTGMVEMPAGWRFPSQKPGTEVIKGENGTNVVVDARSKQPLFRIDENGQQRPPEADAWADSKVAEKYGKQGVGRRLWQDDNGRVSYKYFDLNNMANVSQDSADEVLGVRNNQTKQRSDATPPKAGPDAAGPAGPAAVGLRNPYANAKGQYQPSPNTPTGQSNVGRAIDALPDVVKSLDDTVAGGDTKYLRDKIARKEQLSVTERVRAQQFGLLPN